MLQLTKRMLSQIVVNIVIRLDLVPENAIAVVLAAAEIVKVPLSVSAVVIDSRAS